MKFTVVFPAHEAIDLSYGLVFIPCPVWMKGTSEVINLNPETPHYQPGSVRKLMDHEGITPDLMQRDNRTVAILIHQTGNGSQSDLETLVYDLKEEGFWVGVFG